MVRWLERKLGNMPVDVTFNDVDLKEQEQDFLFHAQQILPYEFLLFMALAQATHQRRRKSLPSKRLVHCRESKSFSVLSTNCL